MLSNFCLKCNLKEVPNLCDDESCDVHDSTYAQRLRALLRSQKDEIERLRAIVDKIQKTADGVPIIQGNWVWTLFSDGCVAGPYMVLAITCRKDCPIDLSLGEFQTKQLFSTREAAEAAREK